MSARRAGSRRSIRRRKVSAEEMAKFTAKAINRAERNRRMIAREHRWYRRLWRALTTRRAEK